MGKEYTILVQSNAGVGGLNNEKTFKFDWSIIPEGEYDLTFTFVSELLKTVEDDAEETTAATRIEFISPFSSNSYKTELNGHANSSTTIGLLEVKSVDGIFPEGAGVPDAYSMRHWISRPDNPSIRLWGRPQGQDFKIILSKTNGVPAIIFPVKYDMIIKLRHIC